MMLLVESPMDIGLKKAESGSSCTYRDNSGSMEINEIVK